jgi:hypothetical protein
MGLRDKWYPACVGAMIQIRGEGPTARGATGERLPLLQALDTIAILAQLSAPLVGAIKSFHHKMFDDEDLKDHVMASRHYDSDSEFIGVPDVLAHLGVLDRIKTEDYVAGYGQPFAPYRRSKTIGGKTYEPGLMGGVLDWRGDPGLLNGIREAMRAWESAVTQSAAMLDSYGANITMTVSTEYIQDFFAALRNLCSTLDAVNAVPPPDIQKRVVEALKVATSKAGEVAGAGAAHIAETIGRTAGSAAEGFFATGNLTAIMVAGLAVFLMVR